MVSRRDIEATVAPHADGTLLALWVVPGASRSEVVGVHDGALRVRVASPAADGQANSGLLKLVGRLVAGPVEILRGASSRRKTLLVRRHPPAVVADRLYEHLTGVGGN